VIGVSHKASFVCWHLITDNTISTFLVLVYKYHFNIYIDSPKVSLEKLAFKSSKK